VTNKANITILAVSRVKNTKKSRTYALDFRRLWKRKVL